MASTHDRHMTWNNAGLSRPSATPPRAMPTLPVQAEVANDDAAPRLPTTVVSSWKGGVWKTAISASIAERLAFAGLDVLRLVTDDQLHARRRLGIFESDPDVARVQRGPGSITVVWGSRARTPWTCPTAPGPAASRRRWRGRCLSRRRVRPGVFHGKSPREKARVVLGLALTPSEVGGENLARVVHHYPPTFRLDRMECGFLHHRNCYVIRNSPTCSTRLPHLLMAPAKHRLGINYPGPPVPHLRPRCTAPPLP